MHIKDLVTTVQKMYLSQLGAFLVREVSKDGRLDVERDTGMLTKHLELPSRSDFTRYDGDGNFHNLRCYENDIIAFPCTDLSLNQGISATIAPFKWSSCRIVFCKDYPEWSPVADWFERWYAKSNTGEPFGSCVHSISDPVPHDRGQSVIVDLGSAPPEAMFELWSMIFQTEADRIEIGGDT